jgi:uncharacterized membrane protein (DUF485 family)
MDHNQKLQAVRRKTRQRLGFTLLTLVMYFTYVLNYTEGGAFLGEKLGDTYITGSLVMFASLIVLFLGLEIVFMVLNRDGRGE